ncbi:hypothetical protein M8J76_000121 [Diaphorina citri]|nr:hypothetical protein M8J75_003759 [Diaphorina citri]KAI5729200.1 hypothetical protein M8J76_000121 [Diaphorina citri]
MNGTSRLRYYGTSRLRYYANGTSRFPIWFSRHQYRSYRSVRSRESVHNQPASQLLHNKSSRPRFPYKRILYTSVYDIICTSECYGKERFRYVRACEEYQSVFTNIPASNQYSYE